MASSKVMAQRKLKAISDDFLALVEDSAGKASEPGIKQVAAMLENLREWADENIAEDRPWKTKTKLTPAQVDALRAKRSAEFKAMNVMQTMRKMGINPTALDDF